MEEDTFDLSLMEQSLKSSDLIDKEISRSLTKARGYNTLKMLFTSKNGNFIHAEAKLKGPEYFLLTQTTRKKNNRDTAFFNSFGFNNAQYPASTFYTDTLLDFEVRTPVKPALDSSLTNFMYKVLHDENFIAQFKNENYWPKNQYGWYPIRSHRRSFYHCHRSLPPCNTPHFYVGTGRPCNKNHCREKSRY